MKNLFKRTVPFVLASLILSSQGVFASDLSEWAGNSYVNVNTYGILPKSIIVQNLQDNITKEEFTELIMNVYKTITNETIKTPVNSPFVDTNNPKVLQAYCYGIVSGLDDNHFEPNKLLTREEMAKIVVNMLIAAEVDLELKENFNTNFTDEENVSFWALSSLQTVVGNDLLYGIDGEILPQSYTTREQAITIANRLCAKYVKGNNKLQVPYFDIKENEDYLEISIIDYNYSGNYSIIIKDTNHKMVHNELFQDSTIKINKELFKNNGEYYITISARLNNLETFSLPKTYNHKKVVSTKANQIIDYAKQFIGTPYLWGGTTPYGFDCSGFVQYVYNNNNYCITRTTYTQWNNDGKYVSYENLEPADLVYFGSNPNKPSHVGLYVGDGMMLHAPQTGDVVKYTSIDSGYYHNRFIGGKRIF